MVGLGEKTRTSGAFQETAYILAYEKIELAFSLNPSRSDAYS